MTNQPDELEQYHEELMQEIVQRADGQGKLLAEPFFDIYTEELIASGDIAQADMCHYERRGIRIDGYGGDPIQETDATLTVLVNDFEQSQDVSTLTATDMDADFRRLSRFVEQSLQAKFRNDMEETDPAFGLADMIAQRWKSIVRVRMILLTNKVISTRIDRRDEGEIDSIPVSYSVWDLSRMHRIKMAGAAREDMTIDLVKDYGGAIPALPANLENSEYESYIAVLSGEQLAKIYDKWTDRLLEQNVRVFLQARGNVNRGIRNTLQNDPSMFFAYNNGITATAEAVEKQIGEQGYEITEMKNFQIVNGGQTTGSIYTASNDETVDLSGVFVQMKLSVIPPEQVNDVVPRISEYSNTQNRVNAADFFANHPYHVRIEEFSRRMYTPAKEGTFQQSKWFYERARGQYQDARARLSQGQRREFDIEYPKRQKIDKTDLAKFLHVWEEKPDHVSKGAQKNFAEFAKNIGSQWDKQQTQFNEMYYQHAIAKAIVFRATERLVSSQEWYQGGGLRAPLVAYAIGKVAHDVRKMGQAVDFDQIWRRQEIGDGLEEALTVSALAAFDVINDPSKPNKTEWAKQQAMWKHMSEKEVMWPTTLNDVLVTQDQQKAAKKEAVKDQRELNGMQAQIVVVQAGAEFWTGVGSWGSGKNLLNDKDRSALKVAGLIPSATPSEVQSKQLIGLLARLNEEGCPLALPG